MFKMHAKRIETEQYNDLRKIISVHTFVVIFPVEREYELHSNIFEQLNITTETLSSITWIWRIINADFFSSLTYLKKFILALDIVYEEVLTISRVDFRKWNELIPFHTRL